jgi:hypothetical protein
MPRTLCNHTEDRTSLVSLRTYRAVIHEQYHESISMTGIQPRSCPGTKRTYIHRHTSGNHFGDVWLRPIDYEERIQKVYTRYEAIYVTGCLEPRLRTGMVRPRG